MRLILPALACVLLASCTQGQIDRAAAISAAADARLAQADQAIALATQAVEQGRQLADQIGDVRAQQIVAQAERGLAAARAAGEAAKLAADGAHAALDGAKAAQAAGGSTVDVLIAALTAFIPTAGVAAAAIKKAVASGNAFRQTVAGIDQARAALGEDAWKAKVSPHLASSQDQKVKEMVERTQS